MTSPPERHQLFICYSRADREWVDRLKTMLRPLLRGDDLLLWDDSQIPPGARWLEEIRQALAAARVALLLVSPDFLNSDFVHTEELPPLLRAAEEEGLVLLWLKLRPRLVHRTPIHAYQAAIDPARPLAAMAPWEQEAALETVAKIIEDAFEAARGKRAKVSAGLEKQRLQLNNDKEEREVWQRAAPASVADPQRGAEELQARDQRIGDEAPTAPAPPAQAAETSAPSGLRRVRLADGETAEIQEGRIGLLGKRTWTVETRPLPVWGAVEFCRRLGQRTGRAYSLPSEAFWEWACRAGTTTPFHFGATLSPDLANFDGRYAYSCGPKGEFREHTTAVGRFPANAWGLHDMHGNVWEWCLDRWHPSPRHGPSDGRPWLEPAPEVPVEARDWRLLRGGSWFIDPRVCRSASRDSVSPGILNDNVGFRVCCLPPGLPSWPSSP
ncbi:MAG: SUMF1/EgtB/PvdO family nonheme iron enzyme [Cyanobacteriota bacterium]|nr:SUMF1/EgtB/PvdO family nonheme iron enzyme [Cyanobacteriota bacterium]